ncbi:tetratricopeptide repeat protein [Helicobacter suis]|uniref:Paralysed flagella protein PlfA n=2 Tax=Helicobacter suis TaxID=104628 RepID=A0ABM7KZN9_9HELI|nr:outer membrane protein assembly factor BamD [Helicobacter suis]BCD46022.1 Paralysed flagella protein PlfA [Helicobacter suis]BCD48053.1 Paralysed flagella protein PlfA [Helicobacter suis]BCD49815.1 Paralysed flagella protein PlfA [Helicobacter suis]GFK16547.1 Paralysed flagella protein PlfA [Helicobacter suis]
MPRILGLLMLACALLPALSLTITNGKEKGENFATLTLTHNKPFKCTAVKYPMQEIICTIASIPSMGFMPFQTEFFKVFYEMKNFIFYLHIQPQYKQKLFALPYDYKQSIPIQRLSLESSKTWQIVGFVHTIPFLTTKDPTAVYPEGLNFPILIDEAQTPLIPELDVDNQPIMHAKDQGLGEYLNTKRLIDNGYYMEALESIVNILKLYPDTLFRKDLYFYEITALSHLKKKQDLVIQVASQWIKLYPSDPQVPSVLYALGNAYSQINYMPQAASTFKRIIEEYPKSRYSPLSQMRLAQQAANEGNRSAALMGFQKAYQEAKDIDSASDIAFNWSLFDLSGSAKNAALILAKIIYGNPEYFMKHPVKSYDLLIMLKNRAIFRPAIKIATLLSHQSNDFNVQEKATFELGLLYEKNNQPNEAHLANSEYIDNYNNAIHIALVKARDKKVLFLMHGNYDEKLARYNQILKDYPASSDEYQKALEYKAALLLEHRYYSQVLELKLKQSSPYVQGALIELGKGALKDADCKSFNSFLVRVTGFDPHVFNADEQIQAFDCLYQQALYQKAAIFSQSALKDKSTDKLAWLYRQGRNLYALNDYQNSLLAAKDALSLAILSQSQKHYDIAFTVFLDYMQTNNPQEAFKIYADLAKWFKEDARMIEVYALLLQNEAKSTNNPTTLELYAKNLIALQDKYENNTYTPYAQNQLISALIRQDKLKEALQQSDLLLRKPLDPKDKQHVLYSKGTILKQSNQLVEAQNTFKACVAVSTNSPWKDLCSQALNLLKP